MVRIIYTEYGLADRIEDDILLNKSLKKDKLLQDWILDHEMHHSGKFTKEDLKHDLDFTKSTSKMLFKIFLFQLKHPKTLTQLIPVRIYKKEWCWDIPNLLNWIFGFIIFFIITYYFLL